MMYDVLPELTRSKDVNDIRIEVDTITFGHHSVDNKFIFGVFIFYRGWKPQFAQYVLFTC